MKKLLLQLVLLGGLVTWLFSWGKSHQKTLQTKDTIIKQKENELVLNKTINKSKELNDAIDATVRDGTSDDRLRQFYRSGKGSQS